MLRIPRLWQTRVRLFCIPFAGRGPSVFHAWGDEFREHVQVCPLSLPGREKRIREPLHAHWGPLIDQLVCEMEPYTELPFAILGHSLGGLIAYRLSVEWMRRGKGPLCLFVSAVTAAHRLRRDRKLHQLSDHELLDGLQERYGGIPEQLVQDASMRSLYLPILRADVGLLETYEHPETPLLDCPVIGLQGTDDPRVSLPEFMAWSELTKSGFRRHEIVGSHFFLMERRKEVTAVVAEELERLIAPRNG